VKPAQPPPPTPGAAVDQVGCRYSPHVQAVTVGTTVALLNNDAVLHNVHGTVEASAAPVTVFNVAMPFKGQKLPTVLRKPGVIKLRCDAGHTWMSAYIHVFDHPYFAVTDARGRFVLEGLPPGRYTLEYWHEPLLDEGKPVVKTATVEVAPGQDATADAKLAL
jgi:plastocyanin